MIPLTTDQALRVWSVVEHAPTAAIAVESVRELRYHGSSDLPVEQIQKMWARMRQEKTA